MENRPVYTIARVSVFTDLGTSLAMEFLADADDTIMFWDASDAAAHVAAEQNELGDGWWIVVPRMVSGIRDLQNNPEST